MADRRRHSGQQLKRLRPSSGTLSLLLSSMLDELSVLQMHHELELKKSSGISRTDRSRFDFVYNLHDLSSGKRALGSRATIRTSSFMYLLILFETTSLWKALKRWLGDVETVLQHCLGRCNQHVNRPCTAFSNFNFNCAHGSLVLSVLFR